MHRTVLGRVLVATSFATVVVLAGCNRPPAAPAAADVPAPAESVAPPAAASVSRIAPAQPAARTASFKGYGDLVFGMPSKEVRERWKAPLVGQAPADSGACYQLATDPAAPKALSLMIEGDKLVRYDVSNDSLAPGGGKVGMGIDQLRTLYAGRVREQPDKYVTGGIDLRVSADDGSGSALVFETDAGGKVTSWRVGQPPAVDYVEGCS